MEEIQEPLPRLSREEAIAQGIPYASERGSQPVWVEEASCQDADFKDNINES